MVKAARTGCRALRAAALGSSAGALSEGSTNDTRARSLLLRQIESPSVLADLTPLCTGDTPLSGPCSVWPRSRQIPDFPSAALFVSGSLLCASMGYPGPGLDSFMLSRLLHTAGRCSVVRETLLVRASGPQ